MAKLRVIGCSRDSVWSHRAWAEALGIAFTLVSDWDGEAARAFGVLTDRNGMEVSRRAVFLVDGTLGHRQLRAVEGRTLIQSSSASTRRCCTTLRPSAERA